MVWIAAASDGELAAMCDAIDVVAIARPELIHEDETWSEIVHAVLNEVAARALFAAA
jgi:hypothetical protein